MAAVVLAGLRQQTHCDLTRFEGTELFSYRSHPGVDLHLARKHVRCARWKNTQRYAGMNHSVQDFIDGSVAAGRQYKVRARPYATTRNGSSGSRAGSGNGRDPVPAPGQNINGTLE